MISVNKKNRDPTIERFHNFFICWFKYWENTFVHQHFGHDNLSLKVNVWCFNFYFRFPFLSFFWLHTFHSNENGKKIYSSISNSIICFCDWDLFFQCWLNRKSWSWASFDHYHIEWPLANFIHSSIQKSILLLLIDLNQSIYAIFLATYLIKWMVNMSWF